MACDVVFDGIESEFGRAPDQRKALGQYFTPRWVAEAIVDRHFSGLKPGDCVIEPSCGDGRFLLALPESVDVIGVEIDPMHARSANATTGRRVICGDFTAIDRAMFPNRVHAVVGNPPFAADTIAAFLARSHDLLVEGGTCGFILPAYIFQTSSKVMSMAQRWSIQTELMPRNLFPGLSLPLTFTLFTKEKLRKLHGFFLYREAAGIADMKPASREVLTASTHRGSVWRQAVRQAFDALGTCTASLHDLYMAMSKKPTDNRNWMQQVRKVLQSYPEFRAIERGVWSFDPQAHRMSAA